MADILTPDQIAEIAARCAMPGIADLRDQLRQAERVEQRCDAMDGTISALLPEGPKDTATYNTRVVLYQIVDRVRRGDLPVAMLTGVVLALVPEPWTVELVENHCGQPKARLVREGRVALHARDWWFAQGLECALGLALLEMEGGNG